MAYQDYIDQFELDYRLAQLDHEAELARVQHATEPEAAAPLRAPGLRAWLALALGCRLIRLGERLQGGQRLPRSTQQ